MSHAAPQLARDAVDSDVEPDLRRAVSPAEQPARGDPRARRAARSESAGRAAPARAAQVVGERARRPRDCPAPCGSAMGSRPEADRPRPCRGSAPTRPRHSARSTSLTNSSLRRSRIRHSWRYSVNHLTIAAGNLAHAFTTLACRAKCRPIHKGLRIVASGLASGVAQAHARAGHAVAHGSRAVSHPLRCASARLRDGSPGDQMPLTRPARDHRSRIVASLPFVEALARRMAASMPHSIDIGDLVQDGVIGLIDAAHRFDEGRGIKFETFAERRVRGAMIDALRKDAWPRGVRRQRRELEAAREAAAPRAGLRAVAGRSRRQGRLRRKAPEPHHRPHQHHRVDVAAVAAPTTRRRRRRCRPRCCRPRRRAPGRGLRGVGSPRRASARRSQSLPPREQQGHRPLLLRRSRR